MEKRTGSGVFLLGGMEKICSLGTEQQAKQEQHPLQRVDRQVVTKQTHCPPCRATGKNKKRLQSINSEAL
ncbi:hypothetical protein VU11_00725 [Desulfobulbus sp. US2]|nr:hypothetical protein [Desulfobulbus sp. US2]